MAYCNDCGTKLRNGLCPNCQEEAVIFEQTQYDEEPPNFSQEFIDKVVEQEKKRR